jgi:hypothetical protein
MPHPDLTLGKIRAVDDPNLSMGSVGNRERGEITAIRTLAEWSKEVPRRHEGILDSDVSHNHKNGPISHTTVTMEPPEVLQRDLFDRLYRSTACMAVWSSSESQLHELDIRNNLRFILILNEGGNPAVSKLVKLWLWEGRMKNKV